VGTDTRVLALVASLRHHGLPVTAEDVTKRKFVKSAARCAGAFHGHHGNLP
jgi:hypothetical protein